MSFHQFDYPMLPLPPLRSVDDDSTMEDIWDPPKNDSSRRRTSMNSNSNINDNDSNNAWPVFANDFSHFKDASNDDDLSISEESDHFALDEEAETPPNHYVRPSFQTNLPRIVSPDIINSNSRKVASANSRAATAGAMLVNGTNNARTNSATLVQHAIVPPPFDRRTTVANPSFAASLLEHQYKCMLRNLAQSMKRSEASRNEILRQRKLGNLPRSYPFCECRGTVEPTMMATSPVGNGTMQQQQPQQHNDMQFGSGQHSHPTMMGTTDHTC